MNLFQISEVSSAPSNNMVRGGEVVGGIEILVFKTNLTDPKRISDVGSLLDVHPHIVQWNVDRKDCDNVLRIVSRNIKAGEVENILLNAGYYCEELQ
jgi:hypothetical protein